MSLRTVTSIVIVSAIALTLLSFWALTSIYKSWRKKGDSSHLLFRCPPIPRLFMALWGFWIMLTPIWLMVPTLKDSEGWALFTVFELMAGCAGALCFFGAGARIELKLDRQKHTYRFISGWGWRTRVRSGSWEDFAGVFVRCASGQNSEQYTVGLAWKGGGRVTPVLGRFREQGQARQRADALATEMTTLLGLPRVAPPPIGTIRDLLRGNPVSYM